MYQQQNSQLADGVYELKFEHFPEVKELMAEAFLESNEIWKSENLKKADLLVFFEKVLEKHLQSQERSRSRFGPQVVNCLNYVFNNRIVSNIVYYELTDYIELQKQAESHVIPMFEDLERAGRELTKSVDLSIYAPGTAVFLDFGTLLPNLGCSQVRKAVIVVDLHRRIKEAGFRWMVGRFSNIRPMILYGKMMKSRLVNTVPFERNGKKFNLYWAEFDLHSEEFKNSIEQLEQLIKLDEMSKQVPKL